MKTGRFFFWVPKNNKLGNEMRNESWKLEVSWIIAEN